MTEPGVGSVDLLLTQANPVTPGQRFNQRRQRCPLAARLPFAGARRRHAAAAAWHGEIEWPQLALEPHPSISGLIPTHRRPRTGNRPAGHGSAAAPQPACPLLVPAGGTQQQQPGMEKLNGPNPPWRRLLRSRSSTPTSPAPSRGLLARGGRSAGRGACARRRCAPAGGGCGCGSVAMRVVGTVCGARQTGASRSSRVSSRSHKQRTNNARTAHEQRTSSVRIACKQRVRTRTQQATLI